MSEEEIQKTLEERVASLEGEGTLQERIAKLEGRRDGMEFLLRIAIPVMITLVGLATPAVVVLGIDDIVKDSVEERVNEVVPRKVETAAADAIATRMPDLKTLVGDGVTTELATRLPKLVEQEVEKAVGEEIKIEVPDAVEKAVGEEIKIEVPGAVEKAVEREVKIEVPTAIRDVVKEAVGEEIKIEVPGAIATQIPTRLHIVRAGETLWSIAALYGVTVEAIAAANRIEFPYAVYVGQVLFIPYFTAE